MESQEQDTEATRPFNLWLSRVRREYEEYEADKSLPEGITCTKVILNENKGICIGEFNCFIPFRQGSEALCLIPLIKLHISTPYQEQNDTQNTKIYPFVPPQIIVTAGRIHLAPELLSSVKDNLNQTMHVLTLPILENWNQSTTINTILQAFIAAVQESDPQHVATASKQGDSKSDTRQRKFRIRKRDIYGRIFHANEIDSLGNMHSTPFILQNQSIVLLEIPSREESKEQDGYDIREVIPFREISRITPRREKSLTIFYKTIEKGCRTFFTTQTEEILQDIKRIIGSSRKTSRKDEDTISQLFPFITQEHTEKAKEVSSKIMSKIGSYASSFGRFLRGEDIPDQSAPPPDPLSPVFAEIDQLKRKFHVNPSKEKMVVITRQYQWILEKYGHTECQSVERALEELHRFIEHPQTQRLLLKEPASARSRDTRAK